MLTKSQRVKTGCLTCKIRRVKCDERKPSCLRCTKTGRTCDGYSSEGNPNAVRQYRESRLESRFITPESSSISTVSRRLLPMLPGDDQERKYLTFFRYTTAASFAGYHDISFWDHLIPQIARTEPAVHHAVVALAALHKSFENDSENVPGNDQYSIQQYNKAIARLNKYMSADSCTEVVLICCILFISFEAIRGNHTSAVQHLQGGLKILSHCRQNQRGSKIIQDELVPIFLRLSIQLKTITDFECVSEDAGPSITSIPSTFSSVSEASNSFYIIMDKILDFVDGQSAKLEEKVPPAELSIALEGQGSCALLFEQWHFAFDNLLSRSSKKMSSNDLSGSMLLQVHYATAFIMLYAVSVLQLTYDQFLPQFEKIVSLSRVLIKDSAATMTPGKRSLCIDMGIIAPLYFTATRCRDPMLRREAASILSLPRREGTWDGQGAASIVEQLIATEEEGLASVRVAEDVPESSRILCTELHLVHQESRSARLQCLQETGRCGRKGIITLTC